MSEWAIFGAGAAGREAVDALHLACPDTRPILFDDKWPNGGLESLVARIKGGWNPPVILAVGCGDMAVRRRILDDLDRVHAKWRAIIHPTATISPIADVDVGVVVLAGVVIQTVAMIGPHCFINALTSIDHDCTIGSNVWFGPHACLCGRVTVGDDTLLGAGCVVLPDKKIGRGCIVGAGAVVTHDIPDGEVWCGNPARRLR